MQSQENISKKLLTDKAKNLGLKNVQKLKKIELIHYIQTAEGHVPCFGRIPDCAVSPCLFRGECVH